MKAISQKCATVLLIALCLLGHRSVMAADWVSVGGNVHFGEIPVCALVLVNGQTQFSCDGTGRYDMDVPIDDNGMITVQVYADGFAPFNQIVTPDQAAAFPVDILLDQNSPTLEVIATYEPSATEGRFVVSGTINIGAIPVCALVLANGQNMFSCNENFGQFSLDVPIDPDGNITLFVYAAGFKPFKVITNVLRHSDGDGIPDYLDYDDDNDGIFDEDDVCPHDPGQICGPITDIVIVNGKEWAQVNLFSAVRWDEINAVCPGGLCNGTLRGLDMTGWTWASVDDVNALFNFYGVKPTLGPGPDHDSSSNSSTLTAVEAFFEGGWRATSLYIPGFSGCKCVYGSTRSESGVLIGTAHYNAYIGYDASGFVPSSPSAGTDRLESNNDGWDPQVGAWFFRIP